MIDYDSPSSRPHQASRSSYGSDRRFETGSMAPPLARPAKGGSSKCSSYFDVRPDTMMTSPTATLVADLSQNFHLGASPAVPTPRRSLMAQFSLNEEEHLRHNLPVTPCDDEMQSSPGEIMETSPLPLYGRRGMVRSISMFEPESRKVGLPTLNPPTRSRPPLVPRQAFGSFTMPGVPDRPASRKAYHMGKENDSLAEQFEESPKRPSMQSFGRKLQETFSPTYKENMPRAPLFPVAVNALQRRLPQFRRTQSMVTKNDEFLEPELVLQQTPRGMTHQMSDLTSPGTPESTARECQILPSFESRADQMRRINGVTLAKVLEGGFKHMYDKLVIIDCRFPHEYSGGHIPDAINVSSLEAMDNHPLLTQPLSARTLIVLHCEYSAHRAPRIALHLRNRDRMLNAHRYPALFYPEVYILDGGYSLFYREHRNHIGSMGYVEMNDPTHKPFASKQMHDFRKNTKFQRTHSYTFGQSNKTLGGESMQREENFRLLPSSFESQAPPFLAATARSQSALQFRSPPKAQITVECPKDGSEDDSFGDSSMMDIDDPSMTSPVPCYANTSANTFQRTHNRTSSGRIDPRRLSSF